MNIGDVYQPAEMSALSSSLSSIESQAAIQTKAQNAHSSASVTEVGTSKTAQIPQGSSYWPPYDFTKSEQLELAKGLGGMGSALDWADNEFGVSDALVDLLKKGQE
ncbi:hypothetical protein [Vibrio sp. TRT 2004]|uniref:hypothetical protein n=1 Tax=Vibrio sp. TRT 2004 TaxID=3418506 RepID=UPI003CF3CA9E